MLRFPFGYHICHHVLVLLLRHILNLYIPHDKQLGNVNNRLLTSIDSKKFQQHSLSFAMEDTMDNWFLISVSY